MRLRIRSEEDLLGGVLLIGIGVAAMVIATDYPMGKAMRMGPGYFPTVLGGIMIGLGAIIAARSLFVDGQGIGRFAWRPLIMLCIAFAAFGALVNTAGFVPALIAILTLSALGGTEFRTREMLVVIPGLALGATALFVWGLELPFRLFWWS